MVDVGLVAIFEDGSLGESTIVGALILMSGLTRLATLFQDACSSCEVCRMVFFYFANLLLIVDFHPRWSGRDLRRRILSGFLNLFWGLHPQWRCRDFWCYWYFRGQAEEVLPFLCRRLVSLSCT